MTKPEALKAVAKADEIAELLEHVGWTDNLKKSLDTLRETAVQQLIRSTLGLPSAGPQTPTQAAGVAYGIDYLLATIEAALIKGDKAHYEINKAIAEFRRVD
jgi:hypothetical protein